MIIDLTDWQKQILIGTVIGGSSLVKPKNGKNCYLAMRSNNINWLNYKMYELDDCFRNKKLIRTKNSYIVRSVCNETFAEFYKKLYRNHRKFLNIDVLSELRDIGLCIWFLEAGGKTGRSYKNVYLNLTKYRNQLECIKEYFTILDINMNISSFNNKHRAIFDVPSSMKFLSIIQHRVPDFMLNRL